MSDETPEGLPAPKPLNAQERETTVVGSDGDEVVRIWTAQRRHISRLRKHDSYTEVASGDHGGTEWAEFTIPASEWNPATGAKRKRKPMTEEQRAAAVARLNSGRNKEQQ